MKDYIKRLKNGCPVYRFAFWWIIRALMLGGLCISLFNGASDEGTVALLSVGFIVSFFWEICMVMPEKSALRFMPSFTQSGLMTVVFLAIFGGSFLNLNYTTCWWDWMINLIGGMITVFIGYEFACAMSKRDRHGITKAMAFFVAFGLSFAVGTIWELLEFFIDQFGGFATGTAGDLQHWSYELAENTASIKSFLPPLEDSRWPLMNTMCDIVLNTIGAFAALLIVNIYPYRHKGKYKYDLAFNGEEPVAAILPKESLKTFIPDYIQRLKNNCPKSTYILWWIVRGMMIGLLIYTIVSDEYDGYASFQVVANMCCMFIWEIIMAMPPKNVFRYVPPVLQTLITIFDFVAVVAGLVFNFYYSVRFWDSALHLMTGFFGTFFAYEIVYALIKMERKTASAKVILVCSVGCIFMLETFWELFEFSYDHIGGILSDYPGDAQHWSPLLAEGTEKAKTIFEPYDSGRWPLMDTMGDMVLNTIGIFSAGLILKIYPYRLKGRFRFVFDFDKRNEYSAVKK